MSEDVVREGRVWVFGDNINTDLIFPNTAWRLPEEEQPRMVFSGTVPAGSMRWRTAISSSGE